MAPLDRPSAKVEVAFAAVQSDGEARDTFTRANSAVGLGIATDGSTWVEHFGVWGIFGNKAYVATPQSGVAAIATLPACANGIVAATLTLDALNPGPGLVARYGGPDGGHLSLEIAAIGSASTGKWELWRRFEGGTGGEVLLRDDGVSSQMTALSSGTVPVSLTMAGPLVVVTIDGVIEGIFEDPYEPLGNRAGLRTTETTPSTDTQWDDFACSLEWTDLTAYVRGFRSDRGRDTALDTGQAGTFAVVLDNIDRRFDPVFSSPYWPGIEPGRPIRVTATRAGHSDRPIIRGAIERWQPSNPARGFDALVTVTAVEQTALLQGAGSTGSYKNAIAVVGPSLWYTGSYTFSTDPQSLGASVGIAYGQPTRVTPGLVVGSDDDGATSFDGVNDFVQLALSAAPSGTGPFSLLWLMKITGTSKSIYTMDATGNAADRCSVTVSATGKLVFNAGSVTVTSVASVNTGAAVFCACVREVSGTLRIYLNGVLDASQTGAASTLVQATNVHFLAAASSAAYAMTVDEFTIHNGKAFTARELINLAAATGLAILGAGELTDRRLHRILDLIDWPAQLRATEAGDLTCSPIASGELDPRSYLNKIERTEDSPLFVAADGRLTMRGRTSFLDREPSAAEVYGLGGTGEQPYSSIAYGHDVERVYNEVTVTPDGRGAQTETRPISQRRYGTRALSLATVHETDLDAADLARTIAGLHERPKMRAESIEFTGYANDDWDDLLDVELFDVVKVRRRPPLPPGTTSQPVTFVASGHQANVGISNVGAQRVVPVLWPAGAAAGDVVVVALQVGPTTVGSFRRIFPPSGWEALEDFVFGVRRGVLAWHTVTFAEAAQDPAFYFVADIVPGSGISGSDQFNATQSHAWAVYRNALPARTVDAGSVTADQVTSTSAVAPSVTPRSPGEMLVCAWAVNRSVTVPASMQLREDGVNAGPGFGRVFAVADELLTAETATGTRTATLATTNIWAAVSLTLRPTSLIEQQIEVTRIAHSLDATGLWKTSGRGTERERFATLDDASDGIAAFDDDGSFSESTGRLPMDL